MSTQANSVTVRYALMKEHNMTEGVAMVLVKKHQALVNKGQQLGSMAYYVVDQILEHEDHDCKVSECPELVDEEDDGETA